MNDERESLIIRLNRINSQLSQLPKCAETKKERSRLIDKKRALEGLLSIANKNKSLEGCIISVLRKRFTSEQWAKVIQEAKDLNQTEE
jgi:hypothetical protein